MGVGAHIYSDKVRDQLAPVTKLCSYHYIHVKIHLASVATVVRLV